MIDKIEKKIASHIETILAKDTISFCDYQILVNELNRISTKEEKVRLDNENKQRNEKLLAAFQDAMN